MPSRAVVFHRLLVGLAVVASTAASGCFEPSLRDGQFACSDDGACPPGLQCGAGNICLSDPDNAADGGPPGGLIPDRVDGVLALYLFNDGAGNVVKDSSQVKPELDLEIQVPANVVWNGAAGTLELLGETLIAPPGANGAEASDKIRLQPQNTQELTVEAWVTPKQASFDGPRRIATLSSSNAERSFTLAHGGRAPGVDRDSYHMRLRTADVPDANGRPGFDTPVGTARSQLTHVVFTRDTLGALRAYIDGVLVDTTTFDELNNVDVPATTRSGNFGLWEPAHIFAIGNEIDGGRQWIGTLHLVAVYARALGDKEVEQNFKAGSDPEIAPGL